VKGAIFGLRCKSSEPTAFQPRSGGFFVMNVGSQANACASSEANSRACDPASRAASPFSNTSASTASDLLMLSEPPAARECLLSVKVKPGACRHDHINASSTVPASHHVAAITGARARSEWGGGSHRWFVTAVDPATAGSAIQFRAVGARCRTRSDRSPPPGCDNPFR